MRSRFARLVVARTDQKNSTPIHGQCRIFMKFKDDFSVHSKKPRSQQRSVRIHSLIRNRTDSSNANQEMCGFFRVSLSQWCVFFAWFFARQHVFFSFSIFNSFQRCSSFISYEYICVSVCMCIRHIRHSRNQILNDAVTSFAKCVEIEFKIKLSRWAKILLLKIPNRLIADKQTTATADTIHFNIN